METNTTTNADEARPPQGKFARVFPHIARILMGLAFFVFGLNGFLNFIPQPKDMPETVVALTGALAQSGYVSVAMGTQLLVGVLLLSNRFVPLALALITPILVGIITFHIAVAPSGIGPGIFLMALNLYLAWAYRNAFCPMLRARVTPGRACPP
jgi:uncharacterized membrane protein YphA (DoxX/SURF4 family)